MEDHPYEAVRRDRINEGVSRARFRYLGDAMLAVEAMIRNELNPCTWTVHNTDTGRLCARWRYHLGKSERMV